KGSALGGAEGSAGHEDRRSTQVVVVERAEVRGQDPRLLQRGGACPDRAARSGEIDHACVTVAYRRFDASVPLPRGARQRPDSVAARLQVRLPRGPPVQAQVRAHRLTSYLRAQLRGLPPLPIGKAPRGPDHHAIHRLSCSICSAPSFPLDGSCVFCHAPLSDQDDPAELLEYLIEKIPHARVKRGALNRGPITEAAFDAGGRTFRARWKKDELDLEP